MQEIIDKARVLVEALPYIRAFYDKTTSRCFASSDCGP
jgi:hypothetical protein